MKALLKTVLCSLFLLIVVSVAWIWFSNKLFPSVRRFDMATWVVSCWAAFGTVSTVCMALFGKSVIGHFNKPKLSFLVGKDGSHCYFVEARQEEPGIRRRKLEIYGHIVNAMSAPAHNCHVMTNVAYVSTNGQGNYYPEYEFCTALFKWANSRSFDTTITRDMERYVRLVEIVETETDKLGNPDDMDTSIVERVISMHLCVRNLGAEKECVAIDVSYKGLLVPVRIACDEMDSEVVYFKIVWQGEKLSDYKMADKLTIEKLSEREAKKIITKKGV